jgi:hypothetical protein
MATDGTPTARNEGPAPTPYVTGVPLSTARNDGPAARL